MKSLPAWIAMGLAVSLFQACNLFVTVPGHPVHPGHGSDWDWHHGGWHHGSHGLNALGLSSAEEMAQEFGIRVESAEMILGLAHTGNEQQLNRLGIETSDLAALVQLQMPSHEGIERVAKALNEEPARIEKVAQSFVTDVRAQMSDVNSEYWQECVKSGHWTTPQNARCSKTYWDGCTPDTGATSCEIAQ
jgi:hypothetical protein